MKSLLDEEFVKKQLKTFNAKALISYLESFDLKKRDVDQLVGIMRCGGLPLIEHEDAGKHERRTGCVATITKHIDQQFGDGASTAILDLLSLIGRIAPPSVIAAFVTGGRNWPFARGCRTSAQSALKADAYRDGKACPFEHRSSTLDIDGRDHVNSLKAWFVNVRPYAFWPSH